MKLYTEEQVKKAMYLYALPIRPLEQQVIDILTPIELPSDEEIDSIAKDYGYSIGNKNGTAMFDYIKGAKWMREQVLNQNTMYSRGDIVGYTPKTK